MSVTIRTKVHILMPPLIDPKAPLRRAHYLCYSARPFDGEVIVYWPDLQGAPELADDVTCLRCSTIYRREHRIQLAATMHNSVRNEAAT